MFDKRNTESESGDGDLDLDVFVYVLVRQTIDEEDRPWRG